MTAALNDANSAWWHLTDSSSIITLTLSNSIGESLIHKIFHTCYLSIFELYNDTPNKSKQNSENWTLMITPDGRKHTKEHTMPYSKMYNIIVARQTFVYKCMSAVCKDSRGLSVTSSAKRKIIGLILKPQFVSK